MSKFILVCYGTDNGMELLGKFDTKQEAFDEMISNIESLYDPLVDMSKCEPDSAGNYKCEAEDRSELYWGKDWASCYGRDGDYSDHYGIFEV